MDRSPKRQPSIRATLIKLFLRVTVKRDMARRPIDELPAVRARLDRLSSRFSFPAHVVREPAMTGGVPGEWTYLSGQQRDRVILYLHGGGYLLGSSLMYRDLSYRLSEQCGIPVLVIDYRLAPEHPYPAALDDAVNAYRALLDQGIAAHDIVIAGDSAGGNLSAATLLKLRDQNVPLPTAAVLLSPWLDLTASGDSVRTLAAAEPMLPAHRLVEAAGIYAGTEAKDHPYVSPLFGQLHGLPPLLMHVGTDEVLLDDARRFAAKFESAGGALTYREWHGMFHVFQAFARVLPEGRAALQEIGGFVRSHVGNPVSAPASAAANAR